MVKATNFFNDISRVIKHLWSKRGKGKGRIGKFFKWIGDEARRE